MAKITQGSSKSQVQIIDIPRLNRKIVLVNLQGDSPLITHAWSEKAKAQIRDKQQGKAAVKKGIRNPEQEYQDAMYRLPSGGYGFPAVALKNAVVTAASGVQGLTKVLLRQILFVEGTELADMITIDAEPEIREDTVRLNGTTSDLRYRPEFWPWSAKARISYDADLLTQEQVVHLIDRAGFGVGLCEWRPERNGQFGRFRIQDVLTFQEAGVKNAS